MSQSEASPPLRIGMVSPLWTSVPPKLYGGIERVVHILTEELVKRGHDVTLFATADSRTSAKLRSICDSGVIELMQMGNAFEYEHYVNASLAEALRDPGLFDLIHCHIGCHHIPQGILAGRPVLHTLRAAVTVDDQWLLAKYPEAPVSAISHSQVACVSSERRGTMRVIYNGLNFDSYQYSPTPGAYLAFLGRMGIAKNPLDAIRIAKQAGMPIVLAGKAEDSAEAIYFAEKIQPLLDGNRVVYLGEVDHLRKNELLKNAAALLFPIQWEEPFGNVMIESMACGTPVLAYERGSVREVIDFGKTGFYADSAEALASMVPRALALDRKAVREHAMKRFNLARMVDEYIALYRSLLK